MKKTDNKKSHATVPLKRDESSTRRRRYEDGQDMVITNKSPHFTLAHLGSGLIYGRRIFNMCDQIFFYV